MSLLNVRPVQGLKGINGVYWLLICQFIVLVSLPFFVSGENVSRYQIVVIAYMILELIGLKMYPNVKFKRDLYGAVIFFVISTICTVLLLVSFRAYLINDDSSVWWQILFYSLFVGFGETIVFQGILPKTTFLFPRIPTVNVRISNAIFSQIIFAVAHFYAYSVTSATATMFVQGLFTAFCGGMAMWLLAEYMGLEAAIGFHAGWDLVASRTLFVFAPMLGIIVPSVLPVIMAVVLIAMLYLVVKKEASKCTY